VTSKRAHFVDLRLWKLRDAESNAIAGLIAALVSQVLVGALRVREVSLTVNILSSVIVASPVVAWALYATVRRRRAEREAAVGETTTAQSIHPYRAAPAGIVVRPGMNARWWRRPLCLFAAHDWTITRDARAPLQHLHPLAGCDAVCERCGARWLDFDIYTRVSERIAREWAGASEPQRTARVVGLVNRQRVDVSALLDDREQPIDATLDGETQELTREGLSGRPR
jgi:hypothetical protein